MTHCSYLQCEFCLPTLELTLTSAFTSAPAGIKGAILNKMDLVSYSSYAYNRMQQFRMVKGKVATSKCLLFVVPH